MYSKVHNGSKRLGFGGFAYVRKSVIIANVGYIVPTGVFVFTYTAVLHIHTWL